jgi:predicted transcriptional regulator
MDDVDLNSVQRQVLTAVVNEHRETGTPVTGARLAELVDLHEGTIRTQMSTLTALGLAESIRGPKGGYRPTAATYDALDRERIDDPAPLTLSREFERVPVTVDEIALVNVHDPEHCKARLHFQEDISQYEPGDAIAIGPTPVSRLLLAGVVEAVDVAANEITVANVTLEAPAEE